MVLQVLSSNSGKNLDVLLLQTLSTQFCEIGLPCHIKQNNKSIYEEYSVA